MSPSPLGRFEAEVERLRSLYETTQYSYNEAARILLGQIRSKSIDPIKPFNFRPGENAKDSVNAYAVIRRLKGAFPKYLRETILIRVISSLEVFLLDMVREVFLARRDLFHSNERRLDFSYGELLSASSVTELWSKVINKDVRNLQNQGFKEIVKFYQNRLKIDLTGFEFCMGKLEEFHDRRHIFVHRLGITDDEYRHRYKTELNRLTVSEEYLLGCISDLRKFAIWVHERSAKKMAEPVPNSSKQQPGCKVEIVVECLSEKTSEVLKSNFGFRVGERIHQLDDLLVSRAIEINTHTLTIEGELDAIRAYLKLLKASSKQGHISVRRQQFLRSGPELRKKWKSSEDVLKQIWNSLPARPWPKYIHKQVAIDFNLSNSQAAIAVGLFIQNVGELVPKESEATTLATPAEATAEEVKASDRETNNLP
jgi:hypothetical protein